jgi:hypothetical protein
MQQRQLMALKLTLVVENLTTYNYKSVLFFIIFDVFIVSVTSYFDKRFLNFAGSKIFGYEVGTIYDKVLGFP